MLLSFNPVDDGDGDIFRCVWVWSFDGACPWWSCVHFERPMLAVASYRSVVLVHSFLYYSDNHHSLANHAVTELTRYGNHCVNICWIGCWYPLAMWNRSAARFALILASEHSATVAPNRATYHYCVFQCWCRIHHLYCRVHYWKSQPMSLLCYCYLLRWDIVVQWKDPQYWKYGHLEVIQ